MVLDFLGDFAKSHGVCLGVPWVFLSLPQVWDCGRKVRNQQAHAKHGNGAPAQEMGGDFQVTSFPSMYFMFVRVGVW